MKLKRIVILSLCFISVLTSGCWDKIEIEQRAIIGSIVVDKIQSEEQENKDKHTVFCEENPKKIRVSFNIINPTKVSKGEKAFATRTVEGADITDAVERFGSMTSRYPFYGHTRIILFTEKFLKDDKLFKQIIDELERKAIMNRQMKVAMIKGDIYTLEKVEPLLESTLSGYITGIMDKSKYLSYVLVMDLNKLISMLRNNDGSAVMPVIDYVEKEKQWVKIDKIALIKDYKLLGTLDTKYCATYKILNNEFKGGKKLVDYKGRLIPLYIYSSSKKIWLEDSKDKLKYRVNIEIEADIEQYEFNDEVFENKKIEEINEAAGKSMSEELRESTKYFQKVIGHDYLGFGDYTRKYHNKIFKKYESDWDKQFENVEIYYNVKVNIRRIGNSKK